MPAAIGDSLRTESNTSFSLVPGTIDLNPFCYECPNSTYADSVLAHDPLAHKHTKQAGGCAAHGYSQFLRFDPLFKDAGLFRA